jgi:hypothetical protein
MRFLDAILPTARTTPGRDLEKRYSFDQWANDTIKFGGLNYSGSPIQTLYGKTPAEHIGSDFAGLVRGALQMSGPVSAVEMVRLMVFSEARFQWQRINNGRPGDLFGTQELGILETPWAGGTTGDLLARMILDADFAGSSYNTRIGDEVVRLRPDWVDIVLAPRDTAFGQVGLKCAGYAYYNDGDRKKTPVIFLPEEVAHFAPYPDPLANYRGMSWLTPVVREIQSDRAATQHKLKFFENAAAQPYTSGMLTPQGWAQMGDIKIGDEVIGPDGKARAVLGVYPQGEKDIYKLTFASGVTTECCEDHVWQVSNAYDRKRGTSRLMTLKEILKDGVRYESGTAKWAIPLTDPVEFANPAPLTVEPYLLGLLLGDGSFRSNGQGSGGVTLAVTACDADETAQALAPVLPEGVSITRRDRGGWAEFYFRGVGGPKVNPLTQAVKDLGLFDVPGYDKTIPAAYMTALISDRIALLQGLIDSDGSIETRQHGVRFTTTSQALAEQLAQLVRSLGGTASVKDDGRNGQPTHRDRWNVRIGLLPEWIVPARLSRKRDAYRPNSRAKDRCLTLTSVELVRRAEAQCIKVDAADGLYVTDGFIVTHNTPNLAVSMAKEVTSEQFGEFVEQMDRSHNGTENAYKTLYTAGGADVTVIGADFKQLDFKATQGAGETRIAAAAGVGAILANLSEGMQGSSLNAGNYQAAKRRFADGTMRPLWRNAAASLAVLIKPPPGGGQVRLTFDDRDIAFLREDQRDVAEIQAKEAQTMRTLTDAGWTPESVKAAIQNDGDWSQLVHSGLFSVQLQPPGTASTPPAAPAVTPTAPGGQ